MCGSAVSLPSTTVATYSSACCNIDTNRCIDVSCEGPTRQARQRISMVRSSLGGIIPPKSSRHRSHLFCTLSPTIASTPLLPHKRFFARKKKVSTLDCHETSSLAASESTHQASHPAVHRRKPLRIRKGVFLSLHHSVDTDPLCFGRHQVDLHL